MRQMKFVNLCAAIIFAAVSASTGGAQSQTLQQLPVAGYQAAKDVPGAHERPDPKLTYKVVFDVSKASDNVDKANPMLEAVARYVNTLAQYGVPSAHRMIAVVFHQGGIPVVLKDVAFAARNTGHHNPNIALVQSLSKAGVDFRVCGQGVLGAKIDPADIQPEIELDLWALTTMVNLQLRGYVRVGE